MTSNPSTWSAGQSSSTICESIPEEAEIQQLDVTQKANTKSIASPTNDNEAYLGQLITIRAKVRAIEAMHLRELAAIRRKMAEIEDIYTRIRLVTEQVRALAEVREANQKSLAEHEEIKTDDGRDLQDIIEMYEGEEVNRKELRPSATIRVVQELSKLPETITEEG